MFVQCFDLETKNLLESNGYTYINKIAIEKGNFVYIFMNNGKDMVFDETQVAYTNKMFY
nr:MAG TPA: hypothetical protein [Caudoviricetes sp.]